MSLSRRAFLRGLGVGGGVAAFSGAIGCRSQNIPGAATFERGKTPHVESARVATERLRACPFCLNVLDRYVTAKCGVDQVGVLRCRSCRRLWTPHAIEVIEELDEEYRRILDHFEVLNRPLLRLDPVEVEWDTAACGPGDIVWIYPTDQPLASVVRSQEGRQRILDNWYRDKLDFMRGRGT